MRSQTLFCSGLIVIVGMIFREGALADNCNGRWTGVSTVADSIDLGDGHTLVIYSSRGSSTSENSDHSGVGLCGGYALTTPNGKTRVGYACARKNGNGHGWSDFGGVEPGADRGSWTQAGGTGVFAGKRNSGKWKSVVNDGKSETGTSSGNCQ